MTDSIANEFDTLQLGDKRLDNRCKLIAERFAANPQASINAASQGWNETHAAYEFFDNDSVDEADILAAHKDATMRRIEQQDVVLLVQDTTELNFTKHPTEDSGVLNEDYRFGLYDHSQIAFTETGLCLGVTDVKLFSHDPETLGRKADQRKQLPIQEKESYRWLQDYQQACQLAGEYPDKQVINVADREGDLYDIYVESAEHPTPADFVIRANQPRCTPERDIDAGPSVYKKVADEVAAAPVRLRLQIDLTATPKRAARRATLEVRAKRLTVKPPHLRKADLPEVQLSVVEVREIDGPGDGTEVHWQLLSSLPVDTIDQVQRVIDIYVKRWPIETYFRVYKSGCRIEEIQLETNARQRRALMIYKVVAWRLMYLTTLGRQCPDLDCEAVFAEFEWKPVWKVVCDDPLPEQPPSLGQMILMIGQLGGHNNRRGDNPPGAEAMWNGLRRMKDFSLAWRAFGHDGS
ncbi:Transposase for transposon Tn5 [Stieleria neptunia]|uniref:Transposase for transposon Tn5 n=1 Tax=Stieleria neptunia TaxID=2527979 RepID=A0A518I074_9BACT|nr:IS4 family transposase [Stieleria neptunia]QDV46505.1 Transposase for transposon Tn5 [Stieleria neptunia]